MRKRNRTAVFAADTLKVHPTAQRRIVPVHVKKMMAEFDLDAVGTFHVVDLDGQLWIIDGQHRWTALTRLGMGEWKVNCEIHEVASHAEASALFLKLNNKATIATYDKWENEVTSGDEAACSTKEIVERFGLVVDRQAADGHLACVAAVKRVYGLDRGQTLEQSLTILTSAYGLTSPAVEGKLIEGLSILTSRFNGQLDHTILTKKLAKYPGGASGLIGDGKGRARIMRRNLSRGIADTILDTYNSGRHGDNRLTLA